MAKGLSHLPELKEIGFTASRRLLDVQRISHDPAEGAAALAALNNPVTSPAGTRTAGMRVTDPRTQALLAALCLFRLLPNGFTNRDLRTCLAPLLGLTPEAMTSGQISYDLPAPRGALSYPRPSREELGRRFLGLMTNLAPKG